MLQSNIKNFVSLTAETKDIEAWTICSLSEKTKDTNKGKSREKRAYQYMGQLPSLSFTKWYYWCCLGFTVQDVHISEFKVEAAVLCSSLRGCFYCWCDIICHMDIAVTFSWDFQENVTVFAVIVYLWYDQRPLQHND